MTVVYLYMEQRGTTDPLSTAKVCATQKGAFELAKKYVQEMTKGDKELDSFEKWWAAFLHPREPGINYCGGMYVVERELLP